MGNKSSSNEVPTEPVDGNSTIARAIARGRVYVVVRYPAAVEKLEGTLFNENQFRSALSDLQQALPDYEITLDAGKINRFCEHVTFYNNSDPNKEMTRPRVLVEVFYTRSFVGTGIRKESIKKLLQEKLDPDGHCFIDLRYELGHYHTTFHLETLLRL